MSQIFLGVNMKLHTEQHRDACSSHLSSTSWRKERRRQGIKGEREEEETRRGKMRQEGRRGHVGELNRKEAVKFRNSQEQTRVSSCWLLAHRPQDSVFTSYFANILMIIFLEHTHLKISVYLKLQLELNKCL